MRRWFAVTVGLVERLRAVIDVKRAVWFGSRAQGSGGPDSDWDLLVVAPSTESASWRGYRAEKATSDIAVAKDFLVLTPEEYARYRLWRSSVVYRADKTGVVLYASS